jgi:YVTN family beta-propeller protein
MSTIAALVLASLCSTIDDSTLEGSGTLLVLNKTDCTLSFLNGATGETLAIAGTGVGPHEIAVAPGEHVAAVADYGKQKPGNQLTLIDLEKRTPIDSIDLGEHRRPHGIAFVGADRLLVTSEESQALIEVDVAARKVVRAIPTEQKVSHMVVVTPDAKRAFVANIGSGTVSALDLAAGTLLAKIETGKGSEGIDVSPDGREVWVANREADTLSVIDVEKRTESAEIACAKFPIRVKLTPDGKRALVSNAQSGDVAVIDTATRKELARISMGLRAKDEADQRLFDKQFGDSPVPVGIVIEPSGKRAFVANTNADVITVLDLEKLAIAARFKAGREPDGLAWCSR